MNIQASRGMTIGKIIIVMLAAMTIASCAQLPKPTPAPVPLPSPIASIETPKLQPAASKPGTAVVTTTSTILAVQNALVALGYDAGKPDGKLGPATTKALIAFERDHGFPEDKRLTATLADAIENADVESARVTSIAVHAGDLLIYSDGQEEVAHADRTMMWEQDQPHALMAVRPAMGSWPAAARAGLDWALTHALDAPASAATLKWSSTGVVDRFEIRIYALTAREIALVGSDPSSCRHFELRAERLRYPGLACRDPDGSWYIPHSTVRLARPATGLTVRDGKSSLQKRS